jgi:hypothetical protein
MVKCLENPLRARILYEECANHNIYLNILKIAAKKTRRVEFIASLRLRQCPKMDTQNVHFWTPVKTLQLIN